MARISRTSLAEEGRRVVERLGGRWTERGGMCRCPAHDDRTPSLSIRVGRERLLLHCFAGCASPDILHALELAGAIDPRPPGAASVEWTGRDRTFRDSALRIWTRARPIRGTPAEHYLAGRGIRTDTSELRYHPRTPDGAGALTRYRPALIAAVRDRLDIVGVHRTFLARTADSCGWRADSRRGLGRFKAGAVRLSEAGPTLGLAEGIETALSAGALFDVPCWATLGAERFGLVALPSGIRRLLLFLDRDAGGRRAEGLARQAFGEVARVESHYPPAPAKDWNDVVRNRDREVVWAGPD